ncbi:MAG: filamentous hemagglutinin N-terminal domain-containing protein [Cyanobacteriota bacterium]|nr:filamentous hemagglutinin N-terminal domain-containing protein [Cyanobacteriota bacterium]
MRHYQPLKILTAWKKLGLAQIAIAISLSLPQNAIAQIVPDATLGAENSILTPNVPHQNSAIDRIDGGAIRGSNLFHSFQDFNVGNLQQLYFANPTGIKNILGRVTGTQNSNILGTLGVLGNANLFLINPNGIFFGPNARLDVPGSFFAGTSRSLFLDNGYEFGTVNPQSPPLLAVNVRPGLQTGVPQSDITTSGNLTAGQDLTLVGRNLNLEGQIQGGGKLTLEASETLTVRDSANRAFAATAGGELQARGNKIDIFALNHPASGFFSGADMILRSPNSIGANAQFSSGGNFFLETLAGNPGNLSSSDDPIIRASGDVSFDSYTGPSLHIFAGGSVTINRIIITGPDTTNFINETVTLSDGVTTVPINGSAEPTVDIRAGTTAFNPPGISGDPSLFSPTPNTTATPTRADIAIDRIIVPGGLVFLSNQDQPNPALPGDISVASLIAAVDGAGGGDVFIDSRGEITTPGILDASGFDFSSFSFTGRGGDITLIARGDIIMPNSSKIFSYGTGGGNITLKSQSAIIQEPAPSADSFIESAVRGSEQGGDIILEAPFISLSNFVQSNTFAAGAGGELRITADTLEANQAILVNSTRGGDAGKVTVNANSIVLNESQIGSITRSTTGGNAGDVEINANSFAATGLTPAVLSTTLGPGNGGIIEMNVGFLSLREGAQIRGSTRGGDAGKIEINADEIIVDGAALFSPPNRPNPVPIASAILSEVTSGSRGNGSTIEIKTRRLTVSNGAGISASTASTGDAGSVSITATESAVFDGNPGAPLFPSGAFVGTLEGATGKGGTLTIDTPSLSVVSGAQLEALTESGADAGNIIVNAGSVLISGDEETGLFSNTTAGSTGRGGGIVVNSDRVEIANNARISVDSAGVGRGGSIEVRGDRVVLKDRARISAETASADGGDIRLSFSEFILLRRGSQISTTAGNAGAGGNGGNITIVSPFIVAVDEENSDITANAFFGRGGNINVTATAILGLEFRPQLTPLSDITVSSQFGLSGTLILNNPEVDTSSGLVELPEETSDPSDQVVVGCAAAEGNAFTVTGRGGLPEDPTSPLRGQTLLSDLRDFSSTNRSQETAFELHSTPGRWGNLSLETQISELRCSPLSVEY